VAKAAHYHMITFLRDNASLIALIALLFAVANFIYVYFKDKENNRRWDAMNLARIVIRNLRLQTWREMTREAFLATNWGYSDAFAIIPTDDSGLLQHNKHLASAAIVAYRQDGTPFEGPNAITVQELIGFITARHENPQDYHFFKLFRVVFALENNGVTAASDVEIEVTFHDAQLSLTGPAAGPPQTLQPGELTWTAANINFELDERLSRDVRIDIGVSFSDINSNRHRFTNSYSFDRPTGAFRRT
jgi:hypothetical protein